MDDVKEIISQNLKNNRKYCNLSQEKLSEKSNVSRGYIALIEAKKTTPSLTIYYLAKALNITVEELLEDNRISIWH